MKEKYDVHAIMDDLKSAVEMNADLHDGCYQLMRATIEAYAKLSDYSMLDYRDMDLIYLTTIGTWKHNIEAKKRKITESHLLEEDKQSLTALWDDTKQKTIEGKYGNRTDGNTTIGLFGTGLFTFVTKIKDNEKIQNFIRMCVDILPLNDDWVIFERVAQVLSLPFEGIGAAVASMILHCLKPYTFPVLNATMGKPNIFEVLGVNLIEPKQSETYVENCKKIAEFRNKNFTYKNYRIFDLVALNLDKYIISNNHKLITHDKGIRESFEKFINEYETAKGETFAQHPLGNFVRNEIPQIIYDTEIVDSSKYLITASVGQGNWATVPWICIFDRVITTSATKGVYIVYLLSKDTNTLYLTFNQGCTDIRKTNTKKRTIEIMREKAKEIIGRIDSRGFRTDEDIDLGQGLTELAELYQKGTIFYKAYTKGSVPEENELRKDLQNMIEIYKEYVNPDVIPQPGSGGEKKLTIKETVQNIKNYIATEGFSYEDGLIENFYLSLKSKPFVILAGTSGTGKTRLVKLFAKAIGATNDNGRYKMVSVRPDWSDSTDLFGHVDLNGRFIPGVIIDFIKDAQKDIEHPYVLCLDEMNLARVEYYLSDFLSVIETRDFDDEGRIETDPLVPENYYGSDDLARGKYGSVILPENLYVVGTVNMDETTFPFSKKVLDRANTIEFSYVDLMPQAVTDQNVNALNLSNEFLKSKYLILQQCGNEADAVEQYCTELKTVNEILQEANAHIGYRIRDEIVFYLLNNKETNLISESDAFDNELLQKVLPRIQGSSASIKTMLCELFKFCAGDYEGYQAETDISAKMLKKAENPDCKYKKSAKKIAFMVRRYEEDGFTSYWL